MRPTALLLVLWLAAGASAGAGLIAEHDSNHDGVLSWEEAKALGWNRATFDLKDMDGDGSIDETDLFRHVEWLRKPVLNDAILKALDVDGDGRLKKGVDWWWWNDADFARFDADRDGVLDAGELAKIPHPAPQRQAGKKSAR